MKKLVSFVLIFAFAAALIPAATVSAYHNFVETARVDPTCTEDGYVDYVCAGGFVVEDPLMILGDIVLTAEDLYAYSEPQIPNMRLTCTIEELINYYLTIGAKYHLRGDLAYLQAIKETGWFKFNRPQSYLAPDGEGGWVRVYEPRPEGLYAVPTDNNFCGLGITGKLGDEASLCRFATAELGVTAHIQHIYAYATADALPEGEVIVDPRFYYMEHGSKPSWKELGTNDWTSDPDYGGSIVTAYTKALTKTAHGEDCGETKHEILPALGHDWGEWTVTVPAGEETPGSKERVCATCGGKETVEIPPTTQHIWTEWRMTVPATYTAAGEETRVCLHCMKRETRAVAALPQVRYGDIDCDGKITVNDALAVLRRAAGLTEVFGAQFVLSDVDRDCRVTVSDALTVLREAAKLDIVPQIGYPTGRAATLINVRNETFKPVPNDSDTSYPQFFWLPKGTTDYITGESICASDNSLSYFTLRGGHRVYQKDSQVKNGVSILTNELLAAELKSDGRFTYFTVGATQKTPFKFVVHGLYSGDTAATDAYCSNFASVSVTFTDAAGAPAVSTDANPLFSAASVTEADGAVTYTFTLRRKGMFCGFNSYYDASGNLVLRFHNPLNTSNGRLDGAVICLDAGHGGYDTGASGNGLSEAEENVKVALALRTKLQALGATVYITRAEQFYFSDGVRVNKDTERVHRLELISSYDPDLLISVHHNYYENTSANGTEALYFYGFNQALAQKVSDAMHDVSGMKNRGGKYHNVFVYRNHDFMSILLECGFLSNSGDAAWLKASGNTDKLANAVANAVVEYFR
ncbi:MAG: N-acetylmuramoyl-L-alanine amidase [Clostridia bacterium]|nr:N-acetylmuramoyl-L-alanine amidase [Clostridia bacterium]